MIINSEYTYVFDEDKCNVCEGNCCIGESGYIWINANEIDILAKYLNLSIEETVERYLFKAKYKHSIKEKKISQDSFACVFFDLEKKQCAIYDARPKQCRTFPFWDYFKDKVDEVKEECPAIIDL